MENELVRYSRAGDTFHYRWAARRCLRMIDPKSRLRYVVIEGSRERKMAGEYIIDFAEYSDSAKSKMEEIAYFQLKHTTVRKEQPFTLSDLKDTIQGFAERFSGHFSKTNKISDSPKVSFSIVTNRPISENFKQNIRIIGNGEMANKGFQTTIQKYTNLSGTELQAFCASIEFADGEGDYNAQRYELHVEISKLTAGMVDNPQIENVIALVQSKTLPDSNGRIVREEILQRFGVTSERDLYPAPPEFEKIDFVIKSKQHREIMESILNAATSTPIIIHAAGGVGKSVFARQIRQSLPEGSIGIVYDCFGGGRYRNRSESRHRHRDALVQIANELASTGLCEPLIVQSTDLEDEILRAFLERLRTATRSLKQMNQNAILAIVIDAADNAEMAAKEFGHPCFVHDLFREQIPSGCRLIGLCRTERIHLVSQSNTIIKLELEPFSVEETLVHLRSRFPRATEADGHEFHRLTSGNPRVQANALSTRHNSISETLFGLGPSGTTVEKQINTQLNAAISTVKEMLSIDFQDKIDAICLGLASLPPLIPISVLATAAEVDEGTVKSFVSDLGRPLWISDTFVQFRDEPTETWFRERFSASVEQISSYITRLKRLANKSTYVAETLPSLLLQSEKYTELIELANSDEFLPEDNPIDQRNVRVYRLQFAFKAALKLDRYEDAIRLAFRAGEEMAGDKRQLELLTKNVDLIAPLQSEHKVQELAFRRRLRSGWDGSENIYSATLLSSITDFRGEARGYLRAAHNWLEMYFEERQKNKEGFVSNDLRDEDILEFAFTHYNLFGVSKAVKYLISWHPPEVVYTIARKFIKRLIDLGEFSAVNEISQIDSRNQFLMIALAKESLEVGQFPNSKLIEQCLDLLTTKRARIPKPSGIHSDKIASGLVSFAESCAAANMSKRKILRLLRHYIPTKASRSVTSNYKYNERDTFLRAVALRCVLTNNLEPNLDLLLPKDITEKQKSYSYDQEVREYRQMIGGLLPWYILRTRILLNDVDDIFNAVNDANRSSKEARAGSWRGNGDIIPFEISRILIDILLFNRNATPEQVQSLFKNHLKENGQIWMNDRLKAVRAAYRLNHLSSIRRHLEEAVRQIVEDASNEGPETRAEWYTDLARAVLPVSKDDASVYLDYAVEAVSKFGDEIVQRWEAVAAIANRSAENEFTSPHLAYRFIRCAELVGDSVYSEDYFDRNDAVRICAKLSPGSALTAVSRWRDRDVGWFDDQLHALAKELVSSKFLPPVVGWSLSAFFEGFKLEEIASLCIDRELSAEGQLYILQKAIRELRINDVPEESYRKLKKLAQQHLIENNELDTILSFYNDDNEKEDDFANQKGIHLEEQYELETVDFSPIFFGLNLATNSGISQALRRFEATQFKFGRHKEFWKEMYDRIDEGDAVQFLHELITIENADMTKIKFALSCFPDDWHRKVSIKRIWPNVLETVARRFAAQFTLRSALRYFVDDIQVEGDAVKSIKKGILKGLSGDSELVNADTFFGFIDIVATFITEQQATDLLDFALTRFELHMKNDYADGKWSSWLLPPENISVAFTGFVWAALGSPHSKTRWQAAHCVRRLAEANCKTEIDALINWMEKDEVGAFGSKSFPFYNLHARLYLLIALARTSYENPDILKHHHGIFRKHALNNIPHILIQKFSAEIAINLEKAFPKTYSEDILTRLSQVGVSQLPMKKVKGYDQDIESYWHLNGEIDESIEYYHGLDFDSYWFEPLGGVFGISSKQVADLATGIIREWGINTDSGFKSDPRSKLWNSSRNERKTYHSHGSHPRIDTFSFYLSYHAMFSVAAKLLEKMPVVLRNHWYGDVNEDQWTEWFSRHLLTRNDGKWLSDSRDPIPHLRSERSKNKDIQNWRSEITATDFLDTILVEQDGETWLNVFSSWVEGDSRHEETYHVSTALVSPDASQSLLNALSSCRNPDDFRLPNYQDEEAESETHPFVLKGWVSNDAIAKRLDEYDPHAAKIDFPPHQIGEPILNDLGLSMDSEKRECFLPNSDKNSILCELWSTNLPNDLDEDPQRYGNRLRASLLFLKNLCMTQECEIVFKVQINKRVKWKSYMRSDENSGYKPPLCKVYILSADGRLRDTETHYELREGTC